MVLRFLQKEIPSIHGAAFLIGAAGLLSRVLGVFRDRLLASNFGASRTLDVYYASFQIPDFLFTVFLVGAASAAIIPIFLEYSAESQLKAQRFIGGLLYFFSAGAVVLAGITFFVAPFLVRLVAPGFSDSEQELMTLMTRIMMLSPIFLGVSNILSSVMQARRQFVIFALTSIFYNVGIIFGILVFLPLWGPVGLAWGVILGAFLHMAIQLPVLSRMSFRPVFTSWRDAPGLKNVLSLSIPRVFALSMNQFVTLILVALGSFLASGSIAVFQLANNLRYLPVGIFAVSYALAVFPKLSEAAIKKSKEVFYADLAAIVETILFWIIPIAFFTIVLRAHIVRLAFGAGNFNWDDTRITAAALAVFAIAMIGEALAPLFIRAFYALGNTKLPFIVSLVTALVVIGSAPLLVSIFSTGRLSGKLIADILKVGDLDDTAVLGLALALTLGTLIHISLLTIALLFEMRRFFDGSVKNGIALALWRTTISAAIAAFLGYGVLYLLRDIVPLNTFAGVFVQATAAFLVSASAYAVIMYAVGSQEVRSVASAIRQKAARISALPTAVKDHSEPLQK